MEGELSAFLDGEFKPLTVAERIGLAGLCRIKRRYSAAARLYNDALSADPKLADDLDSDHGYNAATIAAAAGTASDEDAVSPDENERTRWHKPALAWLRTDLTARTRGLEAATPGDRFFVRKKLRGWHQIPDLAGVRDPEALIDYPRGTEGVAGPVGGRGRLAEVGPRQQPAESPGRRTPGPRP